MVLGFDSTGEAEDVGPPESSPRCVPDAAIAALIRRTSRGEQLAMAG
jgi:hypothetical protein